MQNLWTPIISGLLALVLAIWSWKENSRLLSVCIIVLYGFYIYYNYYIPKEPEKPHIAEFNGYTDQEQDSVYFAIDSIINNNPQMIRLFKIYKHMVIEDYKDSIEELYQDEPVSFKTVEP